MHNLTNAQTLMLERRRNKETQAQAGKRYGVSESLYSRWERGVHPNPPRAQLNPSYTTALERCYLKRKEANITQVEAAAAMGYSVEWYKLMEKGKVRADKLLSYWRA